MTTQLRPQIADYAHLEPEPDPPPREPDMMQDRRIDDFRAILRVHLAYRDDALIAGGGYLRYRAGDETGQLVPDCVVTFGVNPSGIVERNAYVISEVGKPPDFVLEVGSRSTGRRDYTVKREGYARFGVREYWRFDPTGGRYHGAALAGDVLVGGQYEPLPVHRDLDGLVWGYSEVLGVELCWDAGELWLRDHYSKEFLPTPEDERVMLDDARLMLDDERRGREDDRRVLDGERRRREDAEERVRVLEAELRRRQDG